MYSSLIHLFPKTDGSSCMAFRFPFSFPHHKCERNLTGDAQHTTVSDSTGHESHHLSCLASRQHLNLFSLLSSTPASATLSIIDRNKKRACIGIIHLQVGYLPACLIPTRRKRQLAGNQSPFSQI